MTRREQMLEGEFRHFSCNLEFCKLGMACHKAANMLRIFIMTKSNRGWGVVQNTGLSSNRTRFWFHLLLLIDRFFSEINILIVKCQNSISFLGLFVKSPFEFIGLWRHSQVVAWQPLVASFRNVTTGLPPTRIGGRFHHVWFKLQAGYTPY